MLRYLREENLKKNKSKALELNEEKLPTLGGKKTSKPLEKEIVLEKKQPEAKQPEAKQYSIVCDLEKKSLHLLLFP